MKAIRIKIPVRISPNISTFNFLCLWAICPVSEVIVQTPGCFLTLKEIPLDQKNACSNRLMAAYFANVENQTWLVCEIAGRVVGFAWAESEAMTDRVWNLHAIAVSKSHRMQGSGRALLQAIETSLTECARLLVIDTTQLEEQAAGRIMYQKCGYALSATFADFWEEGVEKSYVCQKDVTKKPPGRMAWAA